MYCPQCGERFSEQARFCPKCGTRRQLGDAVFLEEQGATRVGSRDQPQGVYVQPPQGVYVQPQPGPYIQTSQSQSSAWTPDYQCTFGNAIKRFFNGFVQFKGRSSIREYWFAVLFLFIAGFVIGLIPFVGLVWPFVVFLPSIAVSVRRLHDSNRSGWWCLAGKGCQMIGLILMCIGGAGAIIGAARGSYSYDMSSSLAGMMVWYVFGFLFVLGGGILDIWLYTRPSDPAGVHYDN